MSTPAHALAPGCSLVVCTRNRPAQLRRFLDSLAEQQPQPAALIVVDSSTDAASADQLEHHPQRARLAGNVIYRRVGPELAGVTRQRNVGLALVHTDLAAFFDDDVVLRPGCLAAMERAHRNDPGIVGVGACIENEFSAPSRRWRLRRALFIVPSLAPGRYFGSGRSTPWHSVPATDALIEGDWLPGGAVMWKTAAARATGFDERLEGYGASNDVEFSLRIARHGRQVVSGEARLLHLQEDGGRPDPFALGYSWMRNRRHIHRVGSGDRLPAKAWFMYAACMEMLLEALNLVRPAHRRDAWGYLRGMGRALLEGALGARRT